MIGSSDEESEGDDPAMIGVRHANPSCTQRQPANYVSTSRGPAPPAPRALPSTRGLATSSSTPSPSRPPGHPATAWLIGSNIRNDIWQQLVGPDRVGRFLGMMFGPNGYGAGAGGAQGPGARQVEEYDTRMTHARAKPQIGFTYDFAPDEEDEDQVKKPAVRTRMTIIIPDLPPIQPVEGKGRAIEEVLDLESDEWNQDIGASATTSAGGSASGSTIAAPPRKKRKTAVEVIEVLSNDDEFEIEEEEEETQAESKVQTVLVCAGCRRPLRMGGDWLWTLRCGHMIDSRCYR
ncbi:hypothetical protein FRC09_006091 [Ceratobasidium sp. 395]|nr:hypothetical protein FRC09_006091 [Ceratobasidium sp. 395]